MIMGNPGRSRWLRLAASLGAMALLMLEGLGQTATRPFVVGGQTVSLERAPEGAGAYLRALRPNRVVGRWEVDVVVTNGTDRVLSGPVVLRFDVAVGVAPGMVGVPVDEVGQPYVDLTPLLGGGGLPAGAALRPFTISFGDARTRPTLAPALYAQPATGAPGLVLLRTLTADGIPAEGVRLEEVGPASPRVFRSGRGGWLSLEASAGVVGWRLAEAGTVPVIRLVPAGVAGRVVELASVRLVPEAVSGPTILGAQALPAPLPRGWSPLASAQLPVGSWTLEMAENLPVGTGAVLARWDGASMTWRVVRNLVGNGGRSVDVSEPGLLVVARSDVLPSAPPTAVPGEVLAGIPVVRGAGTLTATGRVDPASRSASRDASRVTAEALVELVSAEGALTSGLVVPGEVTEEYRMRDGTRRVLPAYGVALTGYQQPAGGKPGSLVARFPLRPLQLLPGEELAEAIVRMKVLAPAEFAGNVVEPAGGIVRKGAVEVRIAAGDLGGAEAVLVRPLDVAGHSNALPAGLEAVAGFELGLGSIKPGRKLIFSVGPVAPEAEFLLVRAVFDAGWHGFQPVERLRSDAAGTLVSLEPEGAGALSGIDGGGQYWLFRLAVAQSVVSGVIRDGDGAAVAGAQVRLGPWTALTDAGGGYRLVSPVGRAEVLVRHAVSGAVASGAVDVPGGAGGVGLDLAAMRRGPRLVAVTPTNGATGVPRVTAVQLAFDQPLNAGGIAAGGIRLIDATGAEVPAGVSLNLAGTGVTLLPSAPLAASVRHTVSVAGTVSGVNGLAVEGVRESVFTTESDVLLRTAGVVTSFEPTNGFAAMAGSPGTAEPESPIILVNETTGETATVLSRVDGSFSNSIPAAVDDFLAAVLVNRNGTQNRIPVSKQFFRDGSVALFNGGGILEAEGDGGPVQVIVEPGAIDLKTRFKLSPIPFDGLTNALGTLPATARLLGGVMLTQEGDDLRVGADVSFPIDVAALGLTNAPENCTFALATPREVDGVVAYEIVDRMHYENGRLVTHSPPFTGALLKELQKRFKQARRFDKINRKIAELTGNPDPRAAFYKIALLPLLMSQGRSLIVVGDTYSMQVDDQGKEVAGSRRLVPGASVAFAYEEFQDRPGRLQPGATFTTSGSDGKYSILFPINRLQENGFQVRATHPAFPFQRVTVPVSIPSIGQQFNSIAGPVLGPDPGLLDALQAINNALNQITPKVPAHLGFSRLTAADAAADDSGPPVVTLSVTPREPVPGTNTTDGATVVVSAFDETQISDVALEVVEFQTINPDITNNVVSLTSVSGARTNTGTGALQDAWRLKSQFRANVLVRATGTDAAGNESEALTVVALVGDRQLPPRGLNDTTGPRVLASFPLLNARGVRPGTPVLLQFSESLAKTNLPNVSQWLTVGGAASLASASMSTDGRQVQVFLAPTPGDSSGQVSLTLSSGLVDLAGNGFDQDPVADGEQTYTLQFQILSGESRELDGMASGGGVVQKGAYAYALERTGTKNGSLVVYNLQSNTPVRIAELRVPGYPRDLAMIPAYAFKLHASETKARTNDLIAVVGGVTGVETLQYLWIIDVTDPAQPVRIAGANITFGLTATTKVVWSAPFLAYLDSAADITSVSLVDLQTFLLGMSANADEIAAFPTDGFLGVDANNDGDYVDSGDSLPLPERNPVHFFGKSLSIVDPETDRRIEDFDLESNRGLLGIVLRAGHPYGTDGLSDPTRDVPPAYRTVISGMQSLDPTNSTVNLPVGTVPRRVALFPQVLMEGAANQTFRDLAVVSLSSTSSSSNGLVVIDITDPNRPVVAGSVDLTAYGSPQSLRRREDGLLAVATMADVLLLDPSKLAMPAVAGGAHPALVGVVPGAGSGVRSYVAANAGLNLVNAGGAHRVTYTAPNIRFVAFPQGGTTNVISLSNAPVALLDQVFAQAQYPGTLQKARLLEPSQGTNSPKPAPVDPRSLYFVRVDALGTLGNGTGNLELVLESLNNAGRPLPAPNPAGIPVRLATTNALRALSDTNGFRTNSLPYPRTLRAHRLSPDPTSPYFNVFLAGPFVLTDAPLASNQVVRIQGDLPRAILRPGRFLWAGLDPTNRVGAYPSNILSKVESRTMQPGTLAVAGVSHVPRPLILIPGIAGSYLDDTNSKAPLGTAIGNVANERWIGFGLDSNHRALSLTNSNNRDIVATDIIRHVIRQAEFLPVYGPLLQYLTNDLGFVEYDYRQGAFKDWPRYRNPEEALMAQLANQPDLFVFPYDWRRDNAESATNLQKYVKLVRMFHPEMEKVDILAHSMGGLVARRFELDNPGLVQKCVTIATPWLGAPKAIAALETGDFDSLAMSLLVLPQTLQGLAEDFGGLHQLLPSKGYFQVGGVPMAEFNWDIDGDGSTRENLAYADYRTVIDDGFPTRSGARPISTNELFHSYSTPIGGVDDWRADSTGVEHSVIYGVQKVPRTIGTIRTSFRMAPVQIECSDLILDMPWKPSSEKGHAAVEPKPVFEGTDRFMLQRRFEFVRVEGDGTVPTLSATRRGNGVDLSGDAHLYPMVSGSVEEDALVEHNGLLGNTNVLNLVRDILNDAALPPADGSAPPRNMVVVSLTGHDLGSALLTDGSGATDAGLDVPDGGTGTGITGQLRGLILRFLGWVVRDLGGRLTAEFHIYNTTPGNSSHTLAFDAVAGQPFNVVTRRYSNGIPVMVHQWHYLPGSLEQGELRIDWTDATTNGIRLAVSSSLTNRMPDSVATGDAANDEVAPEVDAQLVSNPDGYLEVDDGVFLRLSPTDNSTDSDRLQVYLGYDRLEDGDPYNDVYRPVASTALITSGATAGAVELQVPDLGMNPATLVVVDGAGTPGLTALPAAPRQADDRQDCPDFTDEKTAMQQAVELAVVAAYSSPWVLPISPEAPSGPHPDRIRFILEQGSGACIWNEQICRQCDGIFNPKSSDHDYEIMLPVFSSHTGLPSGFALTPYAQANVTGDWYFKPPTLETIGGVAQHVYRLPGVYTNVVPADPKNNLKTPANYISEIMADRGAEYLKSIGKPFTAKNLTMFAARAEHFTNGLIDLELPLEAGSDPLGDVGTGRQMLLLKWILEGDYATGYAGPPLSEVFEAFRIRGIPATEAYEWGLYQEFSALGSGALLRTSEITGMARPEPPAHDYLYDVRKKQLKSVGKGAIRATLAAMVGAGLTNLYLVSPEQFRGAGLRGYEEFIARQAGLVQDPSIFTPATVADIQKFYLAKVSDDTFMKDMLEPGNEAEVSRFISVAVRFMRNVQQNNLELYQEQMAILQATSADQHAARVRNLGKIWSGVDSAGKPGLTTLRSIQTVDLVLRVMNDGPLNAGNVGLTTRVDGRPTELFEFGLPTEKDVLFEGKAPKSIQPYVSGSVPSGPGGQPDLHDFTAVAANATPGWREPYRDNNWFGFRFFVLNVDNPVVPARFSQPVSEPQGVPAEYSACRINANFR